VKVIEPASASHTIASISARRLRARSTLDPAGEVGGCGIPSVSVASRRDGCDPPTT
jgi:hypothetical protein